MNKIVERRHRRDTSKRRGYPSNAHAAKRKYCVLAAPTPTAVIAIFALAFHLQLSVALVTVSNRNDNNILYGSSRQANGNQCSRLPFSLNKASHNNISNHKGKSPLVLNYADEWIGADIELAFHNGSAKASSLAAASRSNSKQASTFRRILARFSRTLYLLKESIRTRLERCTVYILECESGKYYVGSTTNRKRRYSEHLKRKGSKWTRVHKPKRVLREYRRIPAQFLLGMESKVTAQTMLEFGVNNVRGSMFCSPREYHIGDIDPLTKFLGHYNDLNYRKVHLRLKQTLPVSPQRMRKRSRYNKIMAGRCYNCGKEGHLAASCPEKQGMKQVQQQQGGGALSP